MNTIFKLMMACLLISLAACLKKESSMNMVPLADARVDTEIQAYLRAHNLEAERDASGLYYNIITQGDSVHFVKATSIPTVIYTNQLISGAIVGNSFGATDFDHRPLKDHIPGWQIGLQKISQGGKIKLYIPPALAFGSVGIPGVIPPNAILISEIELVNIK
ncbi:FKBP-type peptidyl-prolyl isomerase-like protein [Chitinophaga niastensis]|uniref:Peptidyl-prolyl cis-trans isomerase n=1 Tax=Chitinophaga niastensis TaxID=536980 RepID=A0A2P8HPF4_CHINA|nr:FKBP-type peptidyl-prolyl cis-trans isomerase [Chitinophaga niastensis]PSL48098.1 FKBP-type peptidyl-prolyl isomerase-like protein [Chitinophaga niastensis]